MSADGHIIPVADIPSIYSDFNLVHQLLRRQDRETFVLKDPHSDPPNAESVITAKTVQMFIRHNFVMNDPDKDTHYSPFGYRKFAEDMNDFDHNPAKWSFYAEEDQWTTWHVDGEMPTLAAFQVREKDIEMGVPPGHMIVQAERYERATEALWQRDTGRARSIAQSKLKKQSREPGPYLAISSPEKRAALTAKMQVKEQEYRARVGTSRAPSSTPTMSGSSATPMDG
ncbi:hypothetical protein FB451DRAFT_1207661 [Mycena latifolia]|nr:hypothetical protein FB451DRAFT_1212841 [Mycena latifolia]KAJ7496383.1 hypothetical protein FB451DRAFT_1207661 [Mycena latifolia]